MFKLRATAIILPIVTVLAVGGAYFAGHYVGRYDADKRNLAAMKLVSADQSAKELRVLVAISDLIQQSKISEATRVLDLFASLQVPIVSDCLSKQDCASWIAPTVELRDTLQRQVTERSSEQTR